MLRYWLWLTTVKGLSLRAQMGLIRHFGSPEAVFLADRVALEQAGCLAEKEFAALERRDFRLADQVMEDCRRLNLGVVTMQDAGYPRRLLSIELPPLVLYYKGALLPFDELPAVTVVGSRKASGYGLTTAKRMGYQIGACGGTVISGAARGIDSLALEGALSANAPVAAVLGNGLDIVYPYEARGLYEDVMDHGCLISEFVPGTRPFAGNFPRRNRIMSGLSLAVLVVEAPKKSGSLITAEYALEQGRDVFAVPGNVGLDCCEGSNQLIQDGAGLATCGWDVLQGYQARFPDRLRKNKSGGELTLSPRDGQYLAVAEPVQYPKGEAEKPPAEAQAEKIIDNGEKRNYIDLQEALALTQDELALVGLLRDGERHVDELVEASGVPAARVLASLTLLEVKGVVCQRPGKRFALSES